MILSGRAAFFRGLADPPDPVDVTLSLSKGGPKLTL